MKDEDLDCLRMMTELIWEGCRRVVSTILSMGGQISGVISLSVPAWLAAVGDPQVMT